ELAFFGGNTDRAHVGQGDRRLAARQAAREVELERRRARGDERLREAERQAPRRELDRFAALADDDALGLAFALELARADHRELVGPAVLGRELELGRDFVAVASDDAEHAREALELDRVLDELDADRRRTLGECIGALGRETAVAVRELREIARVDLAE